MNLTFKKCTIEDFNNLIVISKETFIDAFEKLNNPDDFQQYLKKAFSIEKMTLELSNSDSTFSFIYCDNVIVGYYKLNERDAQNEDFDMAAMELERIYIKKQFQGKQLGSKALNHIIEIAKKKNKTSLWLGVWEHNLKAIKFYEYHGFRSFGKHLFMLGNDQQYDILMKLNFN